MKYQLVIQFPETLTGGVDLLIKLECPSDTSFSLQINLPEAHD